MKYKESMTMAELANFYRDVEAYIHDNIPFIKENAGEKAGPSKLAKEALDHYVNNNDGYDNEEEKLSSEQEKEFLLVAKKLFKEGSF